MVNVERAMHKDKFIQTCVHVTKYIFIKGGFLWMTRDQVSICFIEVLFLVYIMTNIRLVKLVMRLLITKYRLTKRVLFLKDAELKNY